MLLDQAPVPPPPLRLRPATGRSIGTTAFFRNRALLDTLIGELAGLGRSNLNALFHACSVGAEVYSLLIAAQLDPRLADVLLGVEAGDLEPRFLEFAALGRYPAQVLDGMLEPERACFQAAGAAAVEVLPELRRRVSWLSPASFVDFESARRYDLVVLLNALLYVEGEAQGRALERIGRYCDGLLVTSGFHAERIEQDLAAAGFEPVTRNAEAIHDGWLDRRVAVAGDQLRPGLIYAPWSLPAFECGPGWEWRNCALFRKVRRA